MINKWVKDENCCFKFYICGPLSMKKCIKEFLKELGVKKKDIYSEDFFW